MMPLPGDNKTKDFRTLNAAAIHSGHVLLWLLFFSTGWLIGWYA